eukprot:g6121.t1
MVCLPGFGHLSMSTAILSVRAAPRPRSPRGDGPGTHRILILCAGGGFPLLFSFLPLTFTPAHHNLQTPLIRLNQTGLGGVLATSGLSIKTDCLMFKVFWRVARSSPDITRVPHTCNEKRFLVDVPDHTRKGPDYFVANFRSAISESSSWQNCASRLAFEGCQPFLRARFYFYTRHASYKIISKFALNVLEIFLVRTSSKNMLLGFFFS